MNARVKKGFFRTLATTLLLLAGAPAAIALTPLLAIACAGAVYVAFFRALTGYARSAANSARGGYSADSRVYQPVGNGQKLQPPRVKSSAVMPREDWKN